MRTDDPGKSIAALIRFAKRARQLRDVPFTARTHNVAAQVTTLGKRIAMSGEEMLLAHQSLVNVLDTYPARGLKGAVGTRLDQITLFNGDAGKAARAGANHSCVTSACRRPLMPLARFIRAASIFVR